MDSCRSFPGSPAVSGTISRLVGHMRDLGTSLVRDVIGLVTMIIVLVGTYGAWWVGHLLVDRLEPDPVGTWFIGMVTISTLFWLPRLGRKALGLLSLFRRTA